MPPREVGRRGAIPIRIPIAVGMTTSYRDVLRTAVAAPWRQRRESRRRRRTQRFEPSPSCDATARMPPALGIRRASGSSGPPERLCAVLEEARRGQAGQRSNLARHVGLVRIPGVGRRIRESAEPFRRRQEALHPEHALEHLRCEADLCEEYPTQLPGGEPELAGRDVDWMRPQEPHRVLGSRARLDRADPCVTCLWVEQPPRSARTEDVLERHRAIPKRRRVETKRRRDRVRSQSDATDPRALWKERQIDLVVEPDHLNSVAVVDQHIGVTIRQHALHAVATDSLLPAARDDVAPRVWRRPLPVDVRLVQDGDPRCARR
jgi:hypothetical protein